MIYKVITGICSTLLILLVFVLIWSEKDRAETEMRNKHLREYNKKLCSRLDDAQQENNELYTQNSLLENESNSLKKENKQLKFFIKLLENDTKKKQKGISVCPICGYKVNENDSADDSKSI